MFGSTFASEALEPFVVRMFCDSIARVSWARNTARSPEVVRTSTPFQNVHDRARDQAARRFNRGKRMRKNRWRIGIRPVPAWRSLVAVSAFILASAAGLAQTTPPPPETAGPWQVTIFGGGWNAISVPYVYKTP